MPEFFHNKPAETSMQNLNNKSFQTELGKQIPITEMLHSKVNEILTNPMYNGHAQKIQEEVSTQAPKSTHPNKDFISKLLGEENSNTARKIKKSGKQRLTEFYVNKEVANTVKETLYNSANAKKNEFTLEERRKRREERERYLVNEQNFANTVQTELELHLENDNVPKEQPSLSEELKESLGSITQRLSRKSKETAPPIDSTPYVQKFLEQKEQAKKKKEIEFNSLFESTVDYAKQLFAHTKDKYLPKPFLTEQYGPGWVMKITPQGIFYHHPEKNLWMNTFGIVQDSLQAFFDPGSFMVDNTSIDPGIVYGTTGSNIIPTPITLRGVTGWGEDIFNSLSIIPKQIRNGRKLISSPSCVMAVRDDGILVRWSGTNEYGNYFPYSASQDIISAASTSTNSWWLTINSSGIMIGGKESGLIDDGGAASVPSGFVSGTKVCMRSGGSMALDTNKKVFVWGLFLPLSQRTIPPSVVLNGAIDIDLGLEHCVAVLPNKTVVAWGGTNSFGQNNVPVGLGGVINIAAGDNHTVALKEDGTVVCWGDNTSGQCNVPSFLTNVAKIAAGQDHSVALKQDGTVVCWGDNTNGQCNVPEGIVGYDISAGESYTAIMTSDNVIVLTNLTSSNWQPPTDLNNMLDIKTNVQNAIGLQASGEYSGGITLGQVISWGYGYKQKVAQGRTDIIKIAGSRGYVSQYAITVGNTLYRYGTVNTPVAPPAPMPLVLDVDGGVNHTIGLKLDGTVFCFGGNVYGQSTVPVGLSNVIKVQASELSSFALKADGTLAGWGDNTNNLITGATTQTGIEDICTGKNHIVMRRSNSAPGVKKIRCFGNNTFGQCNVPAGIEEATDIVQLSAGDYHTCVVRADGTVVCWGDNSQGQTSIPASLTDPVSIIASGPKTNYVLYEYQT